MWTKRLGNLIPFASAVLALAVMAAPSPANALIVDSVTLDGGAAYTSGGGFADGDPVTVAPGALIEVVITVSAGGNDNWQCTQWDVGGLTSDDVDHANHDTNNFVGETETFDITAPNAPGTYDLILSARSTDGCSGQIGSATLMDAVIVADVIDLDIVKENVEGPYDLDGVLIGTVEVNQTGPDDGGIWIGLAEPQRFKFEINITNNGAAESAAGAVITDTVPAEYNLDPILQEDDEDGIDGACADTLCDGNALTGVASDNAECTVVASQPPNPPGNEDPPLDQRFLEPELLTITIGDLPQDQMCTITVYVITDGNPGHVMTDDGTPQGVPQCAEAPLNSTAQLAPGIDCAEEDPDHVLLFTLYEPTSCRQVGETTESDPIFDTISLNDGVKLFDPESGERVFGPRGSLQLTCNFPPEL
jgi:hypothetical protein